MTTKPQTRSGRVQQLVGPFFLLAIGIACGMIPSEADGAAMAECHNSFWILMNVVLCSFAAGVIRERFMPNAGLDEPKEADHATR